MTKILKNRLQREHPNISFYFEGIDNIPLDVFNRVEYAAAYNTFIYPSTIFLLNAVNKIAHSPEEIKIICYHEIAHITYGLHYLGDTLQEEINADEFAANRIGWRPLISVLKHIVEDNPGYTYGHIRLARALQKFRGLL